MSSLPTLCLVALCIIGPMMSIDAQNILSMENEQGLGKERRKRQSMCSPLDFQYIANIPSNPWMVGFSPNPSYQNPLNILDPVGIIAEDQTEIKIELPLSSSNAAILIELCFKSINMDKISIVIRDCESGSIFGDIYDVPSPWTWANHCYTLGGPYSNVKSIHMVLYHLTIAPPIQVKEMHGTYCDDNC